MLASTVQFSNNNPTPSHPTPPDPAHPRRKTTSGLRPGTARTEEKAPPPNPGRAEAPHEAAGRARSLRTQQRAYDHPTAPDPAPHPPPKGTGRTGGRHRPAAELVSVPPSSTTPDTSGPTRRR